MGEKQRYCSGFVKMLCFYFFLFWKFHSGFDGLAAFTFILMCDV